MTKNEQWVPVYLESKTPEALKLKMLANNIKRRAYHEYRIVHDGNNWFAWYEVEADEVLQKEFERLNELKRKG